MVDLDALEKTLRSKLERIASRHGLNPRAVELAALKEFLIMLEMAERARHDVRVIVEETLEL
ncbi:MAG: hypothetical protein DRO39_01970 [Thermoprotei archaeon]|nr:MAG: hypothetical protein DRO39_01970 [Thermoprotei archaeon]